MKEVYSGIRNVSGRLRIEFRVEMHKEREVYSSFKDEWGGYLTFQSLRFQWWRALLYEGSLLWHHECVRTTQNRIRIRNEYREGTVLFIERSMKGIPQISVTWISMVMCITIWRKSTLESGMCQDDSESDSGSKYIQRENCTHHRKKYEGGTLKFKGPGGKISPHRRQKCRWRGWVKKVRHTSRPTVRQSVGPKFWPPKSKLHRSHRGKISPPVP